MLEKIFGLFTKENETDEESYEKTQLNASGLIAVTRIKKHFAFVRIGEEMQKFEARDKIKKDFVEKTRCSSCDSEFYYKTIRCPVCEGYEMRQVVHPVRVR